MTVGELGHTPDRSPLQRMSRQCGPAERATEAISRPRAAPRRRAERGPAASEPRGDVGSLGRVPSPVWAYGVPLAVLSNIDSATTTWVGTNGLAMSTLFGTPFAAQASWLSPLT